MINTLATRMMNRPKSSQTIKEINKINRIIYLTILYITIPPFLIILTRSPLQNP